MKFDLLRPPYAVQGQRHHMGAVEDVLVSTATRYGGDLAAVEANGYAAHRLGI